jgi:integrase
VEGASLDVLAPAKVEAWRKAYIAAAADEVARIARKNTTAALIRNARGFFTPALVKLIGERISLPNPLPLSGLATGSSTRRFKSTVDPRKLYAAALAELSGDELTAFLLCIVAGLRKGEADMLPWDHVDLDGALVTVAPTKWFLPKTEESQRSTPVPPDVVAHLRARHAENPAAEFVLSGLDPTKKRDAKVYRCACWKTLAAWLRTKGFASPNPIHELRKLSGSLVNSVAGLEAARRHLGHRNIATTAASYVTGSAAIVNLAAPVGLPAGPEGAR